MHLKNSLPASMGKGVHNVKLVFLNMHHGSKCDVRQFSSMEGPRRNIHQQVQLSD